MILFLIPVALMCLVVIVTVRSGKGFFRWLGWALILSGFLSLTPVLYSPLFNVGRANFAPFSGSNLNAGEIAIDTLSESAIKTIVSLLTTSVLIQVAILIVCGLAAVFISVLIPLPPPQPTDAELEMLVARSSVNPSV